MMATTVNVVKGISVKLGFAGRVFVAPVLLVLTSIAVFFASEIGVAPPAAADVSAVDPDNFGVRIVQHATGGDYLEFFGLPQSPYYQGYTTSSLPFGFSNFSDPGLGDYSDNQSMLDGVQSALGLDPANSDYSVPLSSKGDPATQVEVATHSNLFADDNGTFALNVNTAALANALSSSSNGSAHTNSFSVGVCPLKIAATDKSSRKADAYDSSHNCSWWVESADANDTLNFVETPSADPFWHFLGVLALWVAIVTLVFIIGTVFLRRKLNTLRTPNLVIACAGAFGAWACSFVGTFSVYSGVHSLDEFVLAKDLSASGHVFVATAVSLLLMAPLLIPVVMLVRVRPPELEPAKTAGGYVLTPAVRRGGNQGVPSWLEGPGASLDSSPTFQSPPSQLAPPQPGAPQQGERSPQQGAPQYQNTPGAQPVWQAGVPTGVGPIHTGGKQWTPNNASQPTWQPGYPPPQMPPPQSPQPPPGWQQQGSVDPHDPDAWQPQSPSPGGWADQQGAVGPPPAAPRQPNWQPGYPTPQVPPSGQPGYPPPQGQPGYPPPQEPPPVQRPPQPQGWQPVAPSTPPQGWQPVAPSTPPQPLQPPSAERRGAEPMPMPAERSPDDGGDFDSKPEPSEQPSPPVNPSWDPPA